MASPPTDEKLLFQSALEIPSPEVRDEFLQYACGDDVALLQRLRGLFRAIDQDTEFLEVPASGSSVAEELDVAERVGDTIGPYKLLEEIGQGGFGKVYMAEQAAPIRRKVAVKILKPGMDTREVIARFEVERQALAMMDHPHIARVLDGGATHSGRPYFAMELVRGVPITEYCDTLRLPLRQRLELFIDVCRAVQHAHVKGIIHRDLKPSNVLVTMHDHRAVVKVIDFGIAKALHQPLTERSVFTGFQQMLGTPLYMSPEQAQLSGIDIDTRSDIYSLGVMLYELLTGMTPFTRESFSNASVEELRRIIREQEPPRPSARLTTLAAPTRSTIADRRQIDQRKIGQELRGELDWIVMKALEKDRQRRYESAAEFAADIQRFLDDQPVIAGPPSRLYHLKKFMWRYRWGLATACVVLVSLLGATALSTVSAIRTSIALEQAQRSTERANTLLYATDMRFGELALADGKVRQTVELLERHLPAAGEADIRGMEWFYLNQLAHAQTRSLPLSDKPLYALTLAPDHTQAAVAGADGRIRRVALDSFRIIDEWDSGQQEVNHLTYSRDGTTLLSAGDNGIICFWDLNSQQCIRTIRFGMEKCYVALLDPSERFVIACGEANDVRIFAVESGKLERRLEGHERAIESLDLSPDGTLLAAGSGDSTHSVWDWATGRKTHSSTRLPGRISAVQLPAHLGIVVEGSVDGVLRFSTIQAPVRRVALTLPDQIQSLQLSPGEHRLAVGCRDGTIHIVDTPFPLPLPKKIAVRSGFQTSLGRVYAVKWLDEQTLLMAGESGQLLQTSVHQDTVGVRTLASQRAKRVSLAPDGSALVLIQLDGQAISRYDFRQGGATPLGGLPPGQVWSDITYSPQGDTLVAVTDQGALAICSRDDQPARIHQLPGAWKYPQLSFSANGRYLLIRSAAEDRNLVLDFRVLQPVADFPAIHNSAAALSPQGDFLALNSAGDLLVFDVASRQVIATAREHHAESIRSIAFDSTGDWIVSGGSDRRIQRWRWRTQEAPQVIGLDSSGIPDCFAFTADGRTLITGSAHGQVTLWNIPMGQELFPLIHSGFRFRQICLSRDDRRFVALDDQGEISHLEIRRESGPARRSP